MIVSCFLVSYVITNQNIKAIWLDMLSQFMKELNFLVTCVNTKQNQTNLY